MAGEGPSDRQREDADADDGRVGAEEGGRGEASTDEDDRNATGHVGHPVDESDDVGRRLGHGHLMDAERQDETAERRFDVRQAQVVEPEQEVDRRRSPESRSRRRLLDNGLSYTGQHRVRRWCSEGDRRVAGTAVSSRQIQKYDR